ncbi:AfsR/SARP family transcriptional regulator [Streptomyces profundus]|uniref:AfsR/SARP family transcriptional regulator n=1 Tax=Streptomyces profundus TaxID=2867410 RepID=UPI001D15E6FB|nr:BTAD domain-containing putative transcriptional regulator [Streptomyces sp. MA3_2.13]UED87808.1 winged helix-turn-helix domain-containing protein [Streptomyces sp. MA3_2.13]
MDGEVTITTFGELSVREDGGVLVPFGGAKPRLLLALLLSRPGRVFPVEGLIDALWSGRPPRTARQNLQVYVSRLRRFLGGRLTHTEGGYLLRLTAAECDLVRFAEAAREGRRLAREGDPAAAGPLGEAVALWRGRPLAECGRLPCLAASMERFDEMFLGALEEWAEIEGERGRHRLVRERLRDHAPAHPLRERLAAAWMRSLAESGRTGEALTHYETVRIALARELGAAPGPVLTGLRHRLVETPAVSRGVGNQLPRALPDFVGREVETRDALAAFEDAGRAGRGRVVLVTGPVGVGTSAFAVRVAHRLAPSFPDGLLRVELGDRALGAVLDDLLAAAGLPAERGVAGALARLRSWLAGRRLLLVLDDAVSASVAEALLPGSGPSAALVTSRYRLSGLAGVTRVPLSPLGEAEGVELLGRVVGRDRIAADPRAAERIVRCCEGLPLALRIAAGKLDSLPRLRLAEYADRLATASSLLDELAVGELTLRARYEAFWRSLSPERRAACRRLAARTPPLRHEQVAADAEELVECGLLTPPAGEGGARFASYAMSAFVAEFARDAQPVRRAVPESA